MGRIIKLQPNYVAKGKYQKTYTIRPKLTLTGKWLEEAGFRQVDAFWIRAGHVVFGGWK